MQKFAGSTEGTELEEMYNQYRIEQTEKDIKKLEKKINKAKKSVDKSEQKIQKYENKTQDIIDLMLEDEQNFDDGSEPQIEFPQD